MKICKKTLKIAALFAAVIMASSIMTRAADTADSDSVRKAKQARYLKSTQTSKLTSQIILVSGHELSLWNKSAGGTWKRKQKYYCGYGKNGLSADRHEGDKTTPIGSFPIMFAFGSAANPGTAMTWRDITPYSYWSEEFETYNTWVESKTRIAGEHLIDISQYAYAMAIGFNIEPAIYGRGSAIFLHVKGANSWSTSGCVSLTSSAMKKLLRAVKDGTYIIIVKKDSDIKKY